MEHASQTHTAQPLSVNMCLWLPEAACPLMNDSQGPVHECHCSCLVVVAAHVCGSPFHMCVTSLSQFAMYVHNSV